MSFCRLILGLKVNTYNVKWCQVKLKAVVDEDENHNIDFDNLVQNLSKELISLANDKEKLKNLLQSFLPEQIEQWNKNYISLISKEENK